MQLNQLTIKEAHEGLVKKEFSSVDLAEACLEQVKKVEKKIKAFITLTEDLALDEARKIDKKISQGEEIGIIEGIPVAIKDNMAINGVRTTAGSKILENYIAPYDATVINKLREEGMVLLGRTNMDEFAMGSSTEASYFGPTKNPWNTERVPGGSSGGSAAAVAIDECIYALGSDTGGSIRQPASFCSVVGLKPTYGRVSRFGLLAMASSLDQTSPCTKNVEDAALVLEKISGIDKMDSTTVERKEEEKNWATKDLKKKIKGMKIGVPKEYFIPGMDAEIEKSVREAIKEFERLGAKIEEVSLPHAKYGLAVYYIIMPSEVSANLARYDGIRYGYSNPKGDNLLEVYLKSRQEGFGEEVRRRIMLGTYSLSAGYYDAYYLKAQKVRTLVKKDFDEVFKKVDCLLTPTSPVPPFKIGEKFGDPLTMYLADIFTVSINVAGVPAISLPCGFTSDNLPIGLQIIGKHFDEETILRVAWNYEQATDWHKKKPSLI
jgi:aspartyl-tRNA(Asn)/glutamyl-tRNA(Gln) amidotransferase subunit A